MFMGQQFLRWQGDPAEPPWYKMWVPKDLVKEGLNKKMLN